MEDVRVVTGKTCPSCRTFVDEDSKFCKHCGAKLSFNENSNNKTINVNINKNINRRNRDEYYDESKVRVSEHDALIRLKELQLEERKGKQAIIVIFGLLIFSMLMLLMLFIMSWLS